jgi:PAS domain S-box-containing protein
LESEQNPGTNPIVARLHIRAEAAGTGDIVEHFPGPRAQQGGPSNDELLRFIFESVTDFAIIALDPDGRVIFWNAGAERLLGYESEEILGQSADILFTPEERTAKAPEMERSQASTQGCAENKRWYMRQDGSRFWGSGLLMPLSEPAAGFVKIFRDCTCAQDAETALADKRQLFLAELQHRTRNLLGVVQSMERQTLRRCTSLEEFSTRFESRLGALGRVQGLAATSDETIDLHAIIAVEFSAISEEGVEADWAKVSLGGPPVALPVSAAQALALGLHELTANAIKYGAFADQRASLQVSWRIEDRGGRDWLLFDWRESNVSMPDRGSTRQGGFGSELIERALPYQLKARTKLEFLPDGAHCTIEMAVDADQCGEA